MNKYRIYRLISIPEVLSLLIVGSILLFICIRVFIGSYTALQNANQFYDDVFQEAKFVSSFKRCYKACGDYDGLIRGERNFILMGIYEADFMWLPHTTGIITYWFYVNRADELMLTGWIIDPLDEDSVIRCEKLLIKDVDSISIQYFDAKKGVWFDRWGEEGVINPYTDVCWRNPDLNLDEPHLDLDEPQYTVRCPDKIFITVHFKKGFDKTYTFYPFFIRSKEDPPSLLLHTYTRLK